jgi:hypothetical protein
MGTLKGNTYMHCELAVSGSFGRYFISFNFDVVFIYFRFRSVSQN